VAASCPRCSAAVVAGMRTCQFCGTPVEYVAQDSAENLQPETAHEEVAQLQTAPAALPNATAPPAQNAGPAKTAVNKRRIFGGSPLIPLAAGGLLLFMLFIAARYLLIPKLFAGGDQSFTVNISPRSGASSAFGSVNTSELGVDIYPGARAASEIEHRDTADGTVRSATFISDDSMDKVVEFYRTRMTGQAAIYASGSGVVVSISPSPQQSIIVSIAPAHGEGKTAISITNTTGKSTE